MVNWTDLIMPMVAVATYIICAILKPLMNGHTKYLPLIAALVGCILAFWMKGDVEFSTFVAGLVSGFGATGIDQAISIPMKGGTYGNQK